MDTTVLVRAIHPQDYHGLHVPAGSAFRMPVREALFLQRRGLISFSVSRRTPIVAAGPSPAAVEPAPPPVSEPDEAPNPRSDPDADEPAREDDTPPQPPKPKTGKAEMKPRPASKPAGDGRRSYRRAEVDIQDQTDLTP